MDQTQPHPLSQHWRTIYAVLALAMFGLWGWSLEEPIKHWGDPREDGFSYIAVFYATPLCLVPGLLLLKDALLGRNRGLSRPAVIIAAGALAIVVAFLIFQRIANGPEA